MCEVLHIITGLGQGGAERALFNLLTGGLNGSDRHAVLSLGDEGYYGERLKEAGVAVHVLGMRGSLPTPATARRLKEMVREIRPKIIQGWMYHGNLAASYASRVLTPVPLVSWNVRHSLYSLSHEKPVTRWVIRIGRRWSNKVDRIIYNSETSRKLHEQFGYASANACVLPNGVDTQLYAPDVERRKKVRDALGLSDEDFVIGHVARLHPMKDHAGFLKAAVLVAQENEQIRFMLVGEGVTPESGEFTGIIPEMLKERFIWLGARSDVACLMNAMDAYCLSSWSESFPNVLVEAMASGLPCVATDVGDVATVLGASGSVIPVKDVEALKSSLCEIVEKSHRERETISLNMRERAVKFYNREAVVQRYRELYDSLLKESLI